MGPPLKAAENSFSSRRRAAQVTSFNGAAAKSSGKCAGKHATGVDGIKASMGPPLKAAENVLRIDLNMHGLPASMGPPLKAAENARVAVVDRGPRLIASMGPPLKAAENFAGFLVPAAREEASMGPPLKAAENLRRLISA